MVGCTQGSTWGTSRVRTVRRRRRSNSSVRLLPSIPPRRIGPDLPAFGQRRLPALRGVEAAAGIDLLIGEPKSCGRGLGPKLISLGVNLIWERYPEIQRAMAGPSWRNARSTRAFEKAGFVPVRRVAVPGEADEELVMVCERPSPKTRDELAAQLPQLVGACLVERFISSRRVDDVLVVARFGGFEPKGAHPLAEPWWAR